MSPRRPRLAASSNVLDTDADDTDIIEWLVRLCIGLHVGDFLDDLHALDDSTEDGVLVIQPGLKERDEGLVDET